MPNWLKIKKQEFSNVDFSNNSVDDIIALSNDEFNEFVSLLGNDNIYMLLIFLKTLDEIELAEFFLYLEDVVKLDENVEAPSAKQFEGHLFKIVYSEPMKFIPDYYKQVLAQFRDYYDEENEEHKKVALHLARRFGLLVNSLHVVQKYQDEPYDGLEWFLNTFVEEIKKVDGYEILSDDILIFYMMNTFASIIQEDDNSYISSMIEVVKELMKFYPYLNDSFLYALQELMKSVAIKEISTENANRFLEIFEELPKLYNILSYSKIMELKETINIILANDKPQDNKVFDEDGVKSKLIL